MVINQAPGLSGTPVSGHCAKAATSASWARSSASPTSRTIRTSPAISLVDSRRQTASTASRVIELVTHPMRSRVAQLTNLAAAFPTGPVILVDLHQPPGKLDRLRLASYLNYGVPTDKLFGLGERPIDRLDRAINQRHDCARLTGKQPALINQRAVSHAFSRELAHRLEQRGRRRSHR